jgi:hypothetical protein
MTTTISLATKDCIVLGCDSLATSISPFLDPFQIASHYFESDGNIKKDANGQPVLQTAAQLSAFIRQVPRDQLPNVTKLFQLRPLSMGLLFSGAAGLGSYSVKNLVHSFLESPAFAPFKSSAPTVQQVADSFNAFVTDIYNQAYGTLPDTYKPTMEVLLSGYSAGSLLPEVFRLTFSGSPTIRQEVVAGKYDIIFSGQYDVIERVVSGIDLDSYINLVDRSEEILNTYRDQLQAHLQANNVQVTLPPPDLQNTALQLFGVNFGGVKGLNSNRASLSEQAAINFVEFLIDTMIKAQQFSGSIPTVGGDIHIAIITKADGFAWISKEEYLFRGHAVPKHLPYHPSHE